MDLMLDSTKSKPYLNSEPIINPSIPTSKILFSTRFQQRLHSINFSMLDTNFQPVESKTYLNQVKNSGSIQFIFICTVLQKPYLSLCPAPKQYYMVHLCVGFHVLSEPGSKARQNQQPHWQSPQKLLHYWENGQKCPNLSFAFIFPKLGLFFALLKPFSVFRYILLSCR